MYSLLSSFSSPRGNLSSRIYCVSFCSSLLLQNVCCFARGFLKTDINGIMLTVSFPFLHVPPGTDLLSSVRVALCPSNVLVLSAAQDSMRCVLTFTHLPRTGHQGCAWVPTMTALQTPS